uniref:BZIP domain-containing protein n=1 Tax=Gossypium raimondii TaxID=29730 RepID=A0A0D2NHM8_GOSRA|nr:hypothetical protein B456_005G237400 [Gossypium raimondii]
MEFIGQFDCGHNILLLWKMGSHLNFKNFGGDGNNGSKPVVNSPLVRQSSIYSLTFDELQSTFGGLGKDFGSMNMDELLRNISTAEETQSAMTASVSAGEGGDVSGGNLQKQGSLSLPRTLSQKTVDEVWKYLMKESDGGSNDGSTGGEANLPQRQQTLGTMTLEEFLARAGVVREDMQQIGMVNNGGFFADNSPLALGFQQANTNNGFASGVKSSSQLQQQPQPLFPKQQVVAFAPPMHLMNATQLASPGAKGSPASQISSDVVSKNSIDTTSPSPVPYIFGRGRKCGANLEKVVERRQKRMIKNRESAARSRARKQAYTLELEAEVAKLKEMNQELLKKQEEVMEMQKNQMLEKVNRPWGRKRRCLRRTITCPW